MGGCKKTIDLKVVSKNMLFGFGAATDLFPGDVDIPEPLPSNFEVFFDALFQDAGVVTEKDVYQSTENVWLQMSDENLVTSGPRLTAMAQEFAATDADVICLQECALATNNPLINSDGTERYERNMLENGFYGTEDSTEDTRTFDYAQMIVDRLKKNHGQDWFIAQQVIRDGFETRRSKTTVENVEAIFSFYMTNVILVRCRRNARVIRDVSKGFNFQRTVNPPFFVRGNDPTGQSTVLIDTSFYTRNVFGSIDLEFCGDTVVRIINVHGYPLGNGFWPLDAFPAFQEKYAEDGAANAVNALQMLREEVIPSPHPTMLLGDLNMQPSDIEFPQTFFPATAWLTLCGSVAPDGTALPDGGRMIDVAREVLGPNRYDPQYATNALDSFDPIWTQLRDPTIGYVFFLDHILIRRGDGIQPLEYNVTQPSPFNPTVDQPFAWTSDHNGVQAKLRIPKKCKHSHKCGGAQMESPRHIDVNVEKSVALTASKSTKMNRLEHEFKHIGEFIHRCAREHKNVPSEISALQTKLSRNEKLTKEELQVFQAWKRDALNHW